MGPQVYVDLAPCEIDVGVVVLFFGEAAHFVDEVEGEAEVFEPVFSGELSLW